MRLIFQNWTRKFVDQINTMKNNIGPKTFGKFDMKKKASSNVKYVTILPFNNLFCRGVETQEV